MIFLFWNSHHNCLIVVMIGLFRLIYLNVSPSSSLSTSYTSSSIIYNIFINIKQQWRSNHYYCESIIRSKSIKNEIINKQIFFELSSLTLRLKSQLELANAVPSVETRTQVTLFSWPYRTHRRWHFKVSQTLIV